MNPAEIQAKLTPIFGADIAAAFARIATVHKEQAGGSVSVPSWVLVTVAERVVELSTRSNET